jgi:asparagine synthase (glutamine-hydrolysing)
MCGIAGFISNGNRPLKVFQDVLLEMLTTIAHRGPDGWGIVEAPKQILFGHRRLAIIDIEHGAQPMQSNDGRYTLTFNGEIYNYQELRQSLVQKGIHFETFSDTEVLLKILINEGVSALTKLNGMFAFVFHDKSENTWLMARDHFGIKPLYYSILENEIVFASEIKALLKVPEIKNKSGRDDFSLQQYLTFQFCLEERTLFKEVKKVKPGFYLKGHGSTIDSESCYWNTKYQIDYNHTEEYFIDKLKYLLNDSIRLQLRSDVPLGGYLSGGIDSSLVCALASNHLDSSLPMFHGKFSESKDYDESEYARELVSKTGGTYFEVIPTANDFVDSVPKLIYALDEPLAGPGLFPQYHVSKLAKEHVTVVLGGQGGDEIFGGYARYLVGYLEQALKGAIFETQEEGRHLVSLESIVPQLSLLKQYKPLLSHFFSQGFFQPMDERYFRLIDRSQGLKSLLQEEIFETFDSDKLFFDYQKVFNNPDTQSYINKMTNFDQKTLLSSLLQIEDRVSMAVSLESRVPLLDARIVDLVTSMPPPMKFQEGRTKHILKKAISDILPYKILNRKDKMGFPVPLKEWMQKGPVRDFVNDTLMSKASLQRGIYKPLALEKMIQDQGVGGRQLWGALCLEIWHQTFIDGKN